MKTVELPPIDSRETSLSDFVHIPARDVFQKAGRFSHFLVDLRSRGFETYLRPVLRTSGAQAVVGGQDDLGEHEVTVFCSADYLGLNRDARLIAASTEALARFGVSVSSVPLVAGSTALHRELEASLASFVGTEAAVLFPTGHAANVGLIAAMCGTRDKLVLDKQVHASILDGARLSGAEWSTFKHSEPEDLDRVLQECRARDHSGGILVVVEGVYGIDGDLAPIDELCRVAQKYEARVMIDDAHATGVIGEGGRGSGGGRAPGSPIVMGSLSKSLGGMGGWIATTAAVADYLRYYARTIAFSVGLPPSSAGAGKAALDIIRSDPGLIERLRSNADYFRRGLVDMGFPTAGRSKSAIMSILIGQERLLRDACRALFRKGVWAEGLPLPAVPRGQERIRFRVTSGHTRKDLDHTLAVVEETLTELDILKRRSPAGAAVAPGAVVSSGETGAIELGTASDRRTIEEIAQLAAQSAAARTHPQPWLHPDRYVAVLEGRGAWAELTRERTILTARRSGRLAAAIMAGESAGPPSGAQAFLGHAHWAPGEEAALREVTSAAFDWLRKRGATRILAPMQPPLQFLGGGLSATERTTGLPLLQPQVAPALGECLRAIGFAPTLVMPYGLVRLETAIEGWAAADAVPGLLIRPLDRTHLAQELGRILPILNATVGALRECVPLSINAFAAIADEVRDLILPDIWLLAELKGEVVGFVGGFPEVNAALHDTRGDGGTADVENLGWAMAGAKRGSIAWLGIAPAHGGEGLAKQLLAEVGRRMRARGFTEAWLHWEFVDGDTSGADMFPGCVLERLDYPLLAWQAGSR